MAGILERIAGRKIGRTEERQTVIDPIKRDSLGLLYENLANVDKIADFWAIKSKCSPEYRPPSAPFIGHQIPRTSRLLIATQAIVRYCKLKQGLEKHYMPYLAEPDTVMRMQKSMRPPEDMPKIEAWFRGFV